MSDEALQGLGTILAFLKTSLFGAVTQLVKPSQSHAGGSNSSPIAMWEDSQSHPQLSGPRGLEEDEEDIEDDPYIPIKPARRKQLDDQHIQSSTKKGKEMKLTDYVPDVGYFLAGGLSGITSRTATAPLDRLKVYLIAQTGTSADDTVAAVKSAKPVSALKHGVRALWKASLELWAAGGMRSLFAGMQQNMSFAEPRHSLTWRRKWPQCTQSYARVICQVRRIRGEFGLWLPKNIADT